MSRTILHGVLRMPTNLWTDDPLDKQQRHSRYFYASEVIEGQDAAIEKMIAERTKLQSLLKEFAGESDDPRVLEALSFGSDEPWED